MASEAMRIFIRKYELSSTAIFSRCLTVKAFPGAYQTAAGTILGVSDRTFTPSPSVRLVHPRNACPVPGVSQTEARTILGDTADFLIPALGPPGPPQEGLVGDSPPPAC